MFSMLFYASLVAALLMFSPALYTWQVITIKQLGWLSVLGISSNLILYFLLKTFVYADASTLAPFKYLELPLSAIIGYMFFQEIPSLHSILGGVIIIFSTLFIAYCQRHKNQV